MDDTARHERNKGKLGELHPWMRDRVMGLLVDLEHNNWKPRIQEAYRSPEDQLKAFNSGHSKLKYGYHNCTGPNGEKEAFAVDIYREDSSILIAEKDFCIALAHYAMKQGLITGISWGLPQAMYNATMAAVKANDGNAPVKISWDPCHVQPVSDWLPKLASGWRPEMPKPPLQSLNPATGEITKVEEGIVRVSQADAILLRNRMLESAQQITTIANTLKGLTGI